MQKNVSDVTNAYKYAHIRINPVILNLVKKAICLFEWHHGELKYQISDIVPTNI